MRPAVRLAALHAAAGHLRVDPRLDRPRRGRPDPPAVEHLAALRAIPGLDVVRPADANETVAAWQAVLEHTDRPAGLALTRQNVPTFPRGTDGFADDRRRGPRRLRADRRRGRRARRGAGRHRLRGAARRRGPRAARRRRASGPAWSRCRAGSGSTQQDQAYRDTVIPPIVRARVSVEAGVAQGWREVVGDAGRIVSLEHFGASADYATLYAEFGITAEAVVLRRRGQHPRRPRHRRHDSAWTADPAGTPTAHTNTTGGTDDLNVSRLWPTPECRSGWTTCPASASRPATSPSWSRAARRRRHHQPDDLRRGAAEGERYDDQVAELDAARRRRSTTRSSS